MTKQLRTLALVILASSIAATAAHAGTVDTCVEVNSVSYSGTCPLGTQADSLTSGKSTSGNFAFLFTNPGDMDQYFISGSYFASYEVNGGGSVFGTDLTVSYASGTPAPLTDNFTIDVLQDIYDSSPGTFNGTYNEDIPVILNGAGSSATGQFLWDGQSVGLLTFPGPGSYNKSATATLTGLTGNVLAADAQFDFTFAAGTTFGAGASVTFTPEPVEAAPALFSFLLGAAWIGFRRRSPSGTIKD